MKTDNQTLYPAQAVAAIEERLNKAYTHGNTWIMCQYYADEGDVDEGDYHKAITKSNILEAWHALLNLLETYGHTSLLTAAQAEFQNCKKDPTDSAMGPDEPYLVWPYEVQKYLHIFKELHLVQQEPTVPVDVSQLLLLIRNSEYYITSSRVFTWMPAREDDVHRRIEGLLKCFYPDILHKPTLPKPIKSFEPDTGIPSLQVLIDYKFVESADAGRRIVDEILADIGGYQSDAYNHFIFVVYETQRCFTEGDWNRAIAATKPRNMVTVIVIKGTAPSDRDKEQSCQLKKAFDKANSKVGKNPNKGGVLIGDPPSGSPAAHP
jgi:hypothetical protein